MIVIAEAPQLLTEFLSRLTGFVIPGPGRSLVGLSNLRRQQRPSENEPADRREPADDSENDRKDGKRSWKQADGNHEGDRLESLRDAGQIVNRFAALAGGYQAALLGQGGKGQKSAPVGNEAREQKCRRKRVGLRVPGGEAQRYGRIHKKVERDIKESAAIGRPRCPRNGAIEPIGEAICDQQDQCEVKPSRRDGERRRKS